MVFNQRRQTEFKPALLHLKIDLVPHPAGGERVGLIQTCESKIYFISCSSQWF